MAVSVFAIEWAAKMVRIEPAYSGPVLVLRIGDFSFPIACNKTTEGQLVNAVAKAIDAFASARPRRCTQRGSEDSICECCVRVAEGK